MPLQKSPVKKTPISAAPEEENVEGQLALDVYQTPNEIVIVAPIAGVKMNDISVTVTEDVLTIKGKRYLEFNIPDEDYLTQECFWGDFSRSIVLPSSADTTKINASMKDAVLKVSIPRTERTKTRLIRIKSE
jgi:HSP20 family protein